MYLLKVDNKNTRARYEICSKLTIKTPERRHWLWTYFTPYSSDFVVNFEHIIAGLGWAPARFQQFKYFFFYWKASQLARAGNDILLPYFGSQQNTH